MFKRWLKWSTREPSFELLDEDTSPSFLSDYDDALAVEKGQLEALDRDSLIDIANQRREQIKELEYQIASLHRQVVQLKQLYDSRDKSLDVSKQLAKITRERDTEAQFLRDQHEIRMREMSERTAQIESKLLESRAENTKLLNLLKRLRESLN